MNMGQRFILVCVLTLVGLSALFPLWVIDDPKQPNSVGGLALGRHFLYASPPGWVSRWGKGYRIDLRRMVFEWIAIGTLCGALYLFAGFSRSKPSKEELHEGGPVDEP
jgi:hypothetical protein